MTKNIKSVKKNNKVTKLESIRNRRKQQIKPEKNIKAKNISDALYDTNKKKKVKL